MDKIVTFDDRSNLPLDVFASKSNGAKPSGLTGKTAVVAEVNQGRWIVRCPYCAGAELLREDRLFFCCSCRNEPAGNAYLLVETPDEREQIETALLKRRRCEQMNWQPDETVNDLIAQNKRMGVA